MVVVRFLGYFRSLVKSKEIVFTDVKTIGELLNVIICEYPEIEEEIKNYEFTFILGETAVVLSENLDLELDDVCFIAPIIEGG